MRRHDSEYVEYKTVDRFSKKQVGVILTVSKQSTKKFGQGAVLLDLALVRVRA